MSDDYDTELDNCMGAVSVIYGDASDADLREAEAAVARFWSGSGMGSYWNLSVGAQRMLCHAMEVGYCLARSEDR